MYSDIVYLFKKLLFGNNFKFTKAARLKVVQRIPVYALPRFPCCWHFFHLFSHWYLCFLPLVFSLYNQTYTDTHTPHRLSQNYLRVSYIPYIKALYSCDTDIFKEYGPSSPPPFFFLNKVFLILCLPLVSSWLDWGCSFLARIMHKWNCILLMVSHLESHIVHLLFMG